MHVYTLMQDAIFENKHTVTKNSTCASITQLGEAVITELDELMSIRLKTMWTCSNLPERPGYLSGNALALARDGRVDSGSR